MAECGGGWHGLGGYGSPCAEPAGDAYVGWRRRRAGRYRAAEPSADAYSVLFVPYHGWRWRCADAARLLGALAYPARETGRSHDRSKQMVPAFHDTLWLS